VASGRTATMAHAWNAAGEYSITAQARDSHDSVSGWSAPHVLHVGTANHAPDQPSTPDGPEEVRELVEYEFVSWSDDLDGDSVSLRFAWGDSDTSEWQAYVQSGDTVTATHAWSATGTYAVRAQARDVKESVSEWSLAFAVIVSTSFNTPPSPPSRLEGPGSGYVGISYTFSAAANDPEGDSVSVRFLWARIPAGGRTGSHQARSLRTATSGRSPDQFRCAPRPGTTSAPCQTGARRAR